MLNELQRVVDYQSNKLGKNTKIPQKGLCSYIFHIRYIQYEV